MIKEAHRPPKKLSLAIIVPLTLAVGVFFGLFLQNNVLSGRTDVRSDTTEFRSGGYQFINPLLECEENAGIVTEELTPFRDGLLGLIDALKAKYDANYVAVYYRDLNNGPWIGINEKDVFSPASLTKTPLMIAYFKEAERDPALLQKKLPFTARQKEMILAQNIRSEEALQEGALYSVNDLLYRSIVYSENDATIVLFDNIDKAKLEKIYEDFGIVNPKETLKFGQDLTVKAYASYFRVLYNSSYLSRDFSESALKLLSQVKFADGLVAGVPAGTVVAHKFGERQVKNIDDGSVISSQLHDCGVVYHPKRPYLLCVMTQGNNFTTLDDIIKEISKFVYDKVSGGM